MITLMQVISVRWTKASRGAPYATFRNALPEACEVLIPANTKRTASILLNTIVYDEKDSFENPKILSRWFQEESCTHACFKVEHNTAQTIFTCNLGELGHNARPQRHYYDLKAGKYASTSKSFHISPGQWKRCLYNVRYTGYYGWFYQKHTANVTLIPEPFPDIFTTSKPAEIFSDMRPLI